MSRKKEKKIKRLRKYSLLPQFLETFIVEAAFVVLIIFAILLDMQSSFYTLVTKNSDSCNTIISLVNKNWNASNAQLSDEAQEYIQGVLKYDSEDFDSICLVDDAKKVIASFGPNVPEGSFYNDFSEENFNTNGVYFREDYFNTVMVYYDEDDPDKDKLKNVYDETSKDFDEESLSLSYTYTFGAMSNMATYPVFKKLFLGLNGEKLSMKEYYEWAVTNEVKESLWVMYKTDVPGVNIVFNKVQMKKAIDEARSCFLLIIMLIVFAFIFIYEHYRLIMLIISRQKIKKIINTDPITGGNNKDFFLFKASRIIRRKPRSFAVVYVRMEKYRNYVTAYGIKESENLIEDFNKQLVSLVRRRKEIVAHLEKSDFVLLMHFDNNELMDIRMQQITQALNDCRPNQHLYFSVGACRVISKYDNLEEKISNAAAAISRVDTKVNNVLWFDESMKEEQVWERRVEDDMDKALENHEFQVYLQPKYSTRKEVLSAAEALVRWTHPVLGFISPGKFIPIFERNGFILQLDDYMLTEVAKLQAGWLDQGKKLVPISVNVSRAHFAEDNLAEHICSIVDKYKVPHEFIELELTESAFFDDKSVLLTTVRKLKDFGFKVSMDDFGAGYSSLNSLKELPLDIIKLDAEFFRSVDDIDRSNLIVGQTIALAKKLGMEIVAEGIETREQVDFLAKQNCDLIQGFYFSKPLPVNEFEERAYPKE